MIRFDKEFFSIDNVLAYTKNRDPNFSELLKVLSCKRPSRNTLFEFFMNENIYNLLNGYKFTGDNNDHIERIGYLTKAYRNAGYDYATIPAFFNFPLKEHKRTNSISQNDTAIITDRDSFNKCIWPDLNDQDFLYLKELKDILPKGMKYIAYSPGGVLENTTMLLGYENMCLFLYDDPELVEDVFNKVGEITYEYYNRIADNESIGALIVNDDWGFKSQTMLKTNDMRKYVFPWHKKIVERIHIAGKPAILHSCGNLEKVFTDITEDICYDAKHSYEDTIFPVEQFYEKYKKTIAVLGGIDLDYVCTKSPSEIFDRSKNMLALSKSHGGYALGTGNSLPEYVPVKNYCALLLAALA